MTNIILDIGAGPEQYLTHITITSYTGQGQGPGGAVILQFMWLFSLQFDIGEVGAKRLKVVLEKTCKSDVKNCEISCGSGRDVRTYLFKSDSY
ncbi:hypothetical protein NQ317_014475 [Molorchus minor]|uniref:Uncharacterized protein n=1 Tax=Molorchus minor TaxID=1323400 RepID=A0ABQ9IW19_9CUCU|nr:hypothetical protein NQ317_014475 [Molorchus minor]